jgi:predicted outer membrane repeat protein
MRASRRDRGWAGCVALAALVVGSLLVVGPSAGAADAKCQARDVTLGGASSANLGQVVAGAAAGDTIEVQGTCTLVDANVNIALTIVGKVTKAAPTPTVTANGGGKILVVGYDGNLALRSLTLKGGRNSSDANFGAGAIENLGALTITGSRLVGNSGLYGGAIENYGTLALTDSKVNDNHAAYQGGAIENFGTLTIVATSKGAASVTGNTSGGYSGAIDNYASLTLSGPVTVSSNTAVLNGGAIDSAGDITLIGKAVISGNSAGYVGGGISANGGSITMSSQSRITGNTADTLLLGSLGGGIYACGTTLAGVGANVSGNTPDDVALCP